MKTTSHFNLSIARATHVLTWLVIAALVSIAPHAVAADATLAEMFELGIYSEETKGDIPAAMKLYEQIVAEADAGQALAAQAQFRLAICHDKQKDYAAATAAFEKLIRDFPQQKEFVALANEYLADGAALLPAPWVDGEEMHYNVKLPTGFKIGAARHVVAAGERDDRKIWRFDSNVLGGNMSWSRIEVDAASFKPIRCLWKHSMIGEYDTTYGSGGADVRVKGKEEVKHFDLQGAVYDNEQFLLLVRRLPLATGYVTTIRIFIGLGGGSQLPLELTVPARESVTVPAGTFDAFKVALNIGQTLWISADEHRYPVKMEAGGAILELTAVKVGATRAPANYQDPACGFSVTVPAGWMMYLDDEHRAGRSELRLLDADAVARIVVKVDTLENADAATLASVRAFAERRIDQGKKHLKNFTVRADSWTETTVDGQPALSVVADFLQGEQPQAVRAVYAFVNGYAVDTWYTTAPEDLETFRPQFDAVVASYRGN
jgi:hypothetical protein